MFCGYFVSTVRSHHVKGMEKKEKNNNFVQIGSYDDITRAIDQEPGKKSTQKESGHKEFGLSHVSIGQ